MNTLNYAIQSVELMTTVNDFPFLAPNITVFEAGDRNSDGIYTIGSRQIHVFPFELQTDQQIRVPINQLGRGQNLSTSSGVSGQEQRFDQAFRQSLSIRAWISSTPNGAEIKFRWHPGTGGISHLFFDKDISPTPMPQLAPQQRNQMSQITFQPRDVLVPLIPGKYFYNVLNMEGSPANDLDNTPNSYRILFLGGICD